MPSTTLPSDRDLLLLRPSPPRKNERSQNLARGYNLKYLNHGNRCNQSDPVIDVDLLRLKVHHDSVNQVLCYACYKDSVHAVLRTDQIIRSEKIALD